MDANVDTVSLHDPDAVVLWLPLLLLLLRPNPRALVGSQAPPFLDAEGRGFQNDHITRWQQKNECPCIY